MDIHEFIRDHRHVFSAKDDGGIINPPYYDFEKEVIDAIISNRPETVIKKSRQMHLTTLFACYCAWFLLYNEDLEKNTIVYFTNKIEDSVMFRNLVWSLMSYALKTINNSSVDITRLIESNSKKELSLSNGNRLLTDTTNVNPKKLDTIFYDEYAFIDSNKKIEIYDSTKGNTVNKVYGSTPNGYNDFYKKYNLPGMNVIDLHYSKDPNKDEEWAKKMESLFGSELTYRQEIEAEFVDMNSDKKIKTKNRKTNTIQVRLESDLMEKLGLKLINEDTNISAYVRELIRKDLDS